MKTVGQLYREDSFFLLWSGGGDGGGQERRRTVHSESRISPGSRSLVLS